MGLLCCFPLCPRPPSDVHSADAAAVYFRHCLEDLTGQAAGLQRRVERLEAVTLDAISLEVRKPDTVPLADCTSQPKRKCFCLHKLNKSQIPSSHPYAFFRYSQATVV